MTLYDVGRVCVKLAGRDAGRKCVVIKKHDAQFVFVDGNVRRKRVNVRHLVPLHTTISIKEDASHEEVAKEFEKLGLAVWNRKSKKATQRPRRMKKRSAKSASAAKTKQEKVEKITGKKADKKADKKETKPSQATATPKTDSSE